MQLSNFEQNLLKLHYIFPVPLSRFRKYFEKDPILQHINWATASELAYLLNLSLEKAMLLKTHLMNCEITNLLDTYKKQKIIALPYTHSLYPKKLLQLIDPPAVLYIQGNVNYLHQPWKVAIIGARKATHYSKESMALLVPPLVKNDIVIVSGMAKGADTLAHEAAIYYGGKTIAVLGHGLSHLYPKENAQLKHQLAENQLLITEYPPYMKPEKWTFPMRNRIISGLSDAIIVTESERKSGTMSTVEHALEHSKEVFAVPGPITSKLSEGTNFLIGEGATPISQGFQVVEVFNKECF